MVGGALDIAKIVAEMVFVVGIIALAVFGILKATKKETLITGMRYYFTMIPMMVVLNYMAQGAFGYFLILQAGNVNVADAVRCIVTFWVGLAAFVVGFLSVLLKVKPQIKKDYGLCRYWFGPCPFDHKHHHVSSFGFILY